MMCLTNPVQAIITRTVSTNNYELLLPQPISQPIEFLHGDLIGGSDLHSIIRINRYNQLEWQVERPSKKVVDIVGRFSSIFALFSDGSLECLDDKFGFKKWESKDQRISKISADFPYLLTINTNEELMSLDMKTGNESWERPITNAKIIIGDPRTNTLLLQHNGKISHVNAQSGAILKSRSFRTPITEMNVGNHDFWLVKTEKKLFKINKKTLRASPVELGDPKDIQIKDTYFIVLNREKNLLSSFTMDTLELQWLTPIAKISERDEVFWGKGTVSLHRKNDKVVEVFNLRKGEQVLELDSKEANWDHILMVNSHPLGTQVVFPTEIRLYGYSN